MTRISAFSSPFVLGFDHFEQLVDRIAKNANDGYPPYNIEQIGDDRLRITVAVAGFSADDLAVQVEDNQLVIAGRQEEGDNRAYLHRGIAARQFKRTFLLAEGIEVEGASLNNGLLNVDLRRPHVEPKVRSIKIQAPDAKSSRRETIDLEPGSNS